MTADLSNVQDMLADAVDRGLASGYSMCCSAVGGEIAIGGGFDALSRPIDTRSQFNVYCAIKPLVVTLMAVLIDDGEVGCDDRVGDILPASGEVSGVTIEHLLGHRSGLSRPDPIEVLTLSDVERSELALTAPLIRLSGGESRYTEAAAWIVLGAVIAELSGTDISGAIASRVLSPLELDGEFDLACVDRKGYARMNASRRDNRTRPLLIERTQDLRWASNPGYGGRASMRGLSGIALEWARARTGDSTLISAKTANALLAPLPATRDVHLRRDTTFSRGWLVDLQGHGFGPSLSRSAFAQVGMAGMTSLWAEPTPPYAVAMHVCGFTEQQTDTQTLRSRVVAATLEAIGTSTNEREISAVKARAVQLRDRAPDTDGGGTVDRTDLASSPERVSEPRRQ